MISTVRAEPAGSRIEVPVDLDMPTSSCDILPCSPSIMKFVRAILAALFTSAAVAKDEPKPSAKLNADVMKELRLQWLTKKLVSSAASPTSEKDEVSAALMDWPLTKAIATVLASSVGDASLYTTSTFGVLGGIGHESARKAAVAFTACAQQYLDVAAPTTDYSYPTADQIRFFFVTSSGVRSVTFSAGDVQKPGTPAADLYAHAQEVVTALRLITQNQK